MERSKDEMELNGLFIVWSKTSILPSKKSMEAKTATV